MAKPTVHFRHVFRDVNEGNGPLRVLAIQQWWQSDDDDNSTVLSNGGYWEDLEISYTGEMFDHRPEASQ